MEVKIDVTLCDKKVYFVNEKGEGIQYAVGARSRNEAKLLSYLYTDKDVPYIEIEARLARDKDGKYISTSKSGEFDGEDFIKHGMQWWECAVCNGRNFVPAEKADMYICVACGYKGEIPFDE